MRLSVSESSPDHWRLVMGDQDFRIYIGGELQDSVLEVDTEGGTLTRFARKANGDYMEDPRNRGNLLTETLAGDVEVRTVETVFFEQADPHWHDVMRKGIIEKRRDGTRTANDIPLSFESHYLLTAPFAELMQRQRNRRLPIPRR